MAGERWTGVTLDNINWAVARVVLFQGIYYVKSLRTSTAALWFDSDEDQSKLKRRYETQEQTTTS